MSNKIGILIEIIKYCENVGDKLLIFSHSKIALNFIENVLTHLGDKKKWFGKGHNPNIPKEWGWESQKDYFKLNGDVPSSERESFRKRFAAEARARVMLITKQSDGQGVDIPAANRVILFDIHWNPAVDEQAIFRVCREGKKKTVYVYRFFAEGTMEECIYKRQIVKSSTSKRVHTNSKLDNWFTQQELKELYAFYATEKTLQNVELFEEKSLQQIVKNHPNAIASIHSQDYLLRDTKKK
uniref:Helicase C-terminal domain-containing protein n=1 Tax=Panagrolaimus superbus TaxID=310955 RepID=A0A914Y1V3_9BILA